MQWAAQWQVPLAAIRDLERRLGIAPELHQLPNPLTGTSEAAVSAEAVRQARDFYGAYLWRNNSGAYDASNPPSPGTRWGLGNDSKQVNEVMKTPDFVGIWPLPITPDLVGTTVGQFVGIEMKEHGWRFTGRGRERAQMNFGELVLKLGGRFCFHSGGPLE